MPPSEAETHVRAARARVSFLRPYFAHAIYSLILVESPSCPSMGVDKWNRLYFNPDWVQALSVEQVAVVLIHELAHRLRHHDERAHAMGVTMLTHREANIAQDCEINDDLRDEIAQMGDLPNMFDESAGRSRGPLPENIGCEDYLLWEEYYLHMMDQQDTIQICTGGCGQDEEEGQDDGDGKGKGKGKSGQGQSDPQGGDDEEGGDTVTIQQGGSGTTITIHAHDLPGGSGAHGVPMPWEDGEPDGTNTEGVSAADQADIERLTAEAIRDSVKGRGHVPGSWIEWAKDILRPAHIPWDQLLSAGMRRAITDVSGMVIHSYSRPSRRQNAVPDVVLPCMRRPIPFVCFVGDTSGSMGPDDLALVRGVVEDVCMSLGARIAFLATDADVQGGVQNVGGGSSVEMRGRGGTDMCVGIDYALTQLLPRPNVIVVATDCDTPWPAEDPGVPVIVCAIGRDASVENVPPWATCIPVVEEGQAIHDYDEW